MLTALVSSIADQLRGIYKTHQYGPVILAFTILRRLDCIQGGNKFAQALAGLDLRQALLEHISAQDTDLFDRFRLVDAIRTLDEKGRLRLVVEGFAAVDLHPETVPNADMGDLFETLIREFAEAAEESGEYYTPRDAVRLLVDLTFAHAGDVRTVYDPTAGTGGMLTVAADHHSGDLALFGQELNDQSWAICTADMIARGQTPGNIRLGDTLTTDLFAGDTFDVCLSNPPYGADWKASQATVKAERDANPTGRFGHGLPPVSDGQMLFLTHLAHKMKPGGRAGIILNGSPLFNGSAGSGPSEIRRWLLEHDLVEAIVALPTNLFANTSIATYAWILDNAKRPERQGKVQLIDATGFWTKMRKNLGSKGREISDADRAKVVKLYDDFTDADPDFSKVLRNDEFGYWTITVERPLLDGDGKPVVDRKGKPKPDTKKRDTENVPFTYGGSTAGAAGKDEVIQAYFDAEVKPHVADAWIDWAKVKTGYEIPFTRHFYKYVPPRPLEEIDAELSSLTEKINRLLYEAGLGPPPASSPAARRRTSPAATHPTLFELEASRDVAS